MRFLLIALALAAAAACTPRAGTCDVNVEREVAFTDAASHVRAETIGPNCHQAVALYTIRSGEGDVLWSWTAPLQRAFGDVFAADPDEHLQTFLDRWATPDIATTQSAPEWANLFPGQTTLDQLTYDDIRARDLPMLCHYSGTSRQTCVFWEPIAGGAGQLYDREAVETEP
ncbi:MAG: hypothetical protein DCF16_10705 [Alphaproteobacteria bacterium]|nr:MAG: hypothetical protein DCF16_10705 [Alphaproteobacteria bacterium]